jgi:ESCRT-I complex subunit VPS28
MTEFKLSCPAAFHRLYVIGIPATLEHCTQSSSSRHGSSPTGSGKCIANIIHAFVTLIDSLRLGLVAVDQLHPLLSEILRNLNKYSELASEYQGKSIIKEWLIKINKRKATDELDKEEARQLAFDIEQAHNEFYQQISR